MNVKIGNDGETITVRNSPVNDVFQENAEKVFEEGYDIDSLISKYPNSPAAAFYLYRYFTYQLSLDDLKATRARFPRHWRIVLCEGLGRYYQAIRTRTDRTSRSGVLLAGYCRSFCVFVGL